MLGHTSPWDVQGGPGPRASLPQNVKAVMLTATVDANQPRKVVIAYDAFDVGRQMLTWAAKYCLASDDELFLLQYQVSHTAACCCQIMLSLLCAWHAHTGAKQLRPNVQVRQSMQGSRVRLIQMHLDFE